MVAQRPQFYKRRVNSKTKKAFVLVALGFVGFLAIILLLYNIELYQRRAGLGEQSQELEEEIKELSQQAQVLKEEAAAQETEAYQERVLREQGLYQKPGEQVATILPAEEQDEKEGESAWTWWNPFTWFQ